MPYATADPTRDYKVKDTEVETLNTVEYKSVETQFWNCRLQTGMYPIRLYLLSKKRRATISYDYHEILQELISSEDTLIHFTSTSDHGTNRDMA
jgi:hypothetical protein